MSVRQLVLNRWTFHIYREQSNVWLFFFVKESISNWHPTKNHPSTFSLQHSQKHQERTWMTMRSPRSRGRAVNTYPWQNSVSVRLATQRSLLSLTLRPRVRWKGRGLKRRLGGWKRAASAGACSVTSSMRGECWASMLSWAMAGMMSRSTSGLVSTLPIAAVFLYT